MFSKILLFFIISYIGYHVISRFFSIMGLSSSPGGNNGSSGRQVEPEVEIKVGKKEQRNSDEGEYIDYEEVE